MDWNVATHPLPLSPTHISSPERRVLRRKVQTSSQRRETIKWMSPY
jgi:hypothetical protein